MSHAATGRGGLAGDEPDDGLPDVVADERRGLFLGGAADLADQHDRVGRGVILEETEGVDEARADQRIAADADAGGLPEPEPGQLVDRLVGQRAALRDDADPPFAADVAGNDAGLGAPRRDEPGTVRPDEPAVPLPDERQRPYHVQGGNPFGDADHKRNARIRRLHDRVGGNRRRHEEDRGVRARLAHRGRDRIEHRKPLVGGPPLAGRHPAHDVRAVLDGLPGVKGPFPSRQALDEEPSPFIYQNRHLTSLANPPARLPIAA